MQWLTWRSGYSDICFALIRCFQFKNLGCCKHRAIHRSHKKANDKEGTQPCRVAEHLHCSDERCQLLRAQLYLTPCRVTIPGKNIKRRKLSAARTSSAASAGDEAHEPSCMLMLDPCLRWSIRFPGWQRHGCFAVLLQGWLIGADRQPLWAAWPSYHWEYAFSIHSWGYLSRSRCATFHCRKVPSLNQIWGKIPLSSMTMMYTGRIKCLISVNPHCLRGLCSFLLLYELILIFSW